MLTLDSETRPIQFGGGVPASGLNPQKELDTPPIDQRRG